MKKKKKMGFAAMSPEKLKKIAGMGGKAAWAKGTANKFNKETARIAGSKGGKAKGKSKQRKRKV